MNQLIRTELLKQRTLRTFQAGVVAAPLIAGLIAAAILGAAGTQGNEPLGPESFVQAISGPVSVITVIALILGVIGMAGEYRHETITTTFLSTPRRRDVVLAKLIASSITGALIGALSVAASVAVAIPWLQLSDVSLNLSADTLSVATGAIVSAALYGALGVSVGALIRNQTAACAAVLVWVLAVEGVIGDVLGGSSFVRWLPVSAAGDIARAGAPGDGLTAVVAVAVFTAYVAAFAGVATRLTIQRDVT